MYKIFLYFCNVRHFQKISRHKYNLELVLMDLHQLREIIIIMLHRVYLRFRRTYCGAKYHAEYYHIHIIPPIPLLSCTPSYVVVSFYDSNFVVLSSCEKVLFPLKLDNRMFFHFFYNI